MEIYSQTIPKKVDPNLAACPPGFLAANQGTLQNLSRHFVKVRYFGFFAPGCRKRLLALHKQLEHVYPKNTRAI